MMLKSKDMREYCKRDIKLPARLTKEELFLKSKYEELKKAREMLDRYQSTGSCKSPIKLPVKPKSLKQGEINTKKSFDFKRPTKHKSENLPKRSISVNSFQEDTEPRSIKIRGRHLADEYLRKNFDQFGYIWKIRTNEDRTTSILTFRQPSSAKAAVEELNGRTIDGVNLEISLTRQRNTSWCKAENSSSKSSVVQSKGKSVHITLKGYLSNADIEDFFQTVGTVTRIYLNSLKRFGFVTFETEDQARRAMKEMNGEFYKGVQVFLSPQRFVGSDLTKSSTASPRNEEREMLSYGDLYDV